MCNCKTRGPKIDFLSPPCLTIPQIKAYDCSMNYPQTFNEPPWGVNQILYYPSLDSTNTTLRQLAGEGAPEGTVILADSQKSGRGRLGRSWHSPPGKGIYFSLLLRPAHLEPATVVTITLTAAVSLTQQLRETTGIPVTIKWPNDLLVGVKKLGGILTETTIGGPELLFLILGVGVNINHRSEDFPAELRALATSLALESGRPFQRTALFLSILQKLLYDCRLFFETGFASFQPLWKEMNTTLGKTVEFTRSGKRLRGKAVDLDPKGALLVEDDRGNRHRIICGEIMQSEVL